MEAANRGASEAGGKTIGLNIRLPFEQGANPYITQGLHFEFHYFFMRKFWFAYLAKSLVIFPGGFGTCDELFELLTLAQTDKLSNKIGGIRYRREFWDRCSISGRWSNGGAIAEEDVVADAPRRHARQSLRVPTGHLVEHHLESDQGRKPRRQESRKPAGNQPVTRRSRRVIRAGPPRRMLVGAAAAEASDMDYSTRQAMLDALRGLPGGGRGRGRRRRGVDARPSQKMDGARNRPSPRRGQ
jgi:hypothetical protein